MSTAVVETACSPALLARELDLPTAITAVAFRFEPPSATALSTIDRRSFLEHACTLTFTAWRSTHISRPVTSEAFLCIIHVDARTSAGTAVKISNAAAFTGATFDRDLPPPLAFHTIAVGASEKGCPRFSPFLALYVLLNRTTNSEKPSKHHTLTVDGQTLHWNRSHISYATRGGPCELPNSPAPRRMTTERTSRSSLHKS